MVEEWTLRSDAVFDDFLIKAEGEGDENLFDDSMALAFLFMENVIFAIPKNIVEDSWKKDKEEWTPSKEPTIVIFVNCNDVFAWAYADAEPVDCEDYETRGALYDLLKSYLEDRNHGTVKWVCKKRKMKPQAPMVQQMIEKGSWDADMQDLPDNPYDKDCCDWHRDIAAENDAKVKKELTSYSG